MANFWKMDFSTKCLQEEYSPQSACFGCGPANEKGLKIRSFAQDSSSPLQVVASWRPEPHHEAFPGVLNGGIIGALLDCHSNWTAAYTLMVTQKLDHPPCSVTADFHVKLMRPTPTSQEIYLSAYADPAQIKADRASIVAELFILQDQVKKVCATCTGTFVAVKPGHPAYHRW